MRQTRTFLFIVLLGLAPAAGAAAENTPAKVIDEFHAVLLNVMKQAKSLSTKERYDIFEPAIDKAFNLG